MSNPYSTEPMLTLFQFETSQLIEQLENIVLNCEKTGGYSTAIINEIFRIMHTIKGSSAMMLFNDISKLSHAVEDLFYFIREEKGIHIDYSTLSDLVLGCIDFIKVELEKIKNGDNADGDATNQMIYIQNYLALLSKDHPPTKAIGNQEKKSSMRQQYYIRREKSSDRTAMNFYKATIHFDEGCEMENIRAFTIIHNLKDISEDIYHTPENIADDGDAIEIIRKDGFNIWFRSARSYEDVYELLMQTIFLKELDIHKLEDDYEIHQLQKEKNNPISDAIHKVPVSSEHSENSEKDGHSSHQKIISVQVDKLDKLMNLVGELVISEAMVTQNPDLKGLEIDNFHKAARQLHKITNELQDVVMSIRMVPLAATFQKMHRIVRDMSKKLDKEVQLQLIGEATEVDKNIIEHISDPLMHLVRNAIDHGIEPSEDRAALGKQKAGMVTLEAKNAGSDVLVLVRDDGKGLNKEKILTKARENGLINKPENEMSDKEIYNLIFLPGFSTKESVTEFSGRGVGMDVVTKNIEAIGGSVAVDSVEGTGSIVTLKIPLTLAIIDGMNIRVGSSCYTIPTTTIRESFKPKTSDIIIDPDGNEMIMVRGLCYPILPLHKFYGVKTAITNYAEGILIMIEHDEKSICIFADELLGQQQVVVKALPGYIKNTQKSQGLAGCTLLGDSSISLIVDVSALINMKM